MPRTFDKHEAALRRIVESTRGHARWEGGTPAERELINAIAVSVRTAGEALGVDPEVVGTPLDPALAPSRPLIPGRKPRPIGRD